MAEADPHNFERQFKTEKKKVKKLKYGNNKLLLNFIERYNYKKKALGTMRKTVLLRKLRECATMLNKPMKPFDEKEIKKIVKKIQDREIKRGKPYEPSYWKEYIKDIKIWCKWVNPKKYFEILLECKEELTVQNPYSDPKKKIKEEDIMPDKIFIQLLNAADTQIKAALAILFGAGVRASELLALDRDSLKFLPDSSIIINLPAGKTGTRQLKLRKDLAYYVREWYNASPRK